MPESYFICNMGLKSLLARPYAMRTYALVKKGMTTAVSDQNKLFQQLINQGQFTDFGQKHHFSSIKSHADYVKAVPITDYEGVRPYIEMIKNGGQNVLWPGKPLYLAKTSGTTSGIKYIPISKESIHNHIGTARTALLTYMAQSSNYALASGKMIFLSGSPTLENIGGIPTGRLSGIVNHHVPSYLQGNQLPTYGTNCIEDWEAKLDKIVEETIEKDMMLISGIPPWVQMYFDRLQEKSGKTIKELFPNFKILAHGGVNIEPYKNKLNNSIGENSVHYLETFPASEGFFAFQDTLDFQGLLLNTNSGIFFEFVPSDEIMNENATRLALSEVEIGVNYALIINSNAGLWAYNIGDTVKFVSKAPYRIIVTGRIKHFISAFGEHVIAEEVEHALRLACDEHQVSTIECTVAPNISAGEGKSFHEWFIEFDEQPKNLSAFALSIDNALRKKNIYYEDLIKGNILQPLVIQVMKKNAFQDYMRSIGKLGGQNKVPRLSNDRTIAEALKAYLWQN